MSGSGDGDAAKCAQCGTCEQDCHAALKPCRGCKSVWYCSQACQKAGWEEHRPSCSHGVLLDSSNRAPSQGL
ncbi:hypothetical protein T484DRAFT_1937298 [Baffinella frigidus]|nr:hypothetical protein T484DRAFT_1937298 [Cryptophyta sp. CCMP2293]